MKKNSLISLLIILVIAIFSAVIILNFSKSEKQGVNLGNQPNKNATNQVIIMAKQNLNQNPPPRDPEYSLAEYYLVKFNPKNQEETIFKLLSSNTTIRNNNFILSGDTIYYFTENKELATYNIKTEEETVIAIPGIEAEKDDNRQNVIFDFTIDDNKIIYLKGVCNSYKVCTLGVYNLTSGVNQIIYDNLWQVINIEGEINIKKYNPEKGILTLINHYNDIGPAIVIYEIDMTRKMINQVGQVVSKYCGPYNDQCTSEEEAEKQRYQDSVKNSPQFCDSIKVIDEFDRHGRIHQTTLEYNNYTKTFDRYQFTGCVAEANIIASPLEIKSGCYQPFIEYNSYIKKVLFKNPEGGSEKIITLPKKSFWSVIHNCNYVSLYYNDGEKNCLIQPVRGVGFEASKLATSTDVYKEWVYEGKVHVITSNWGMAVGEGVNDCEREIIQVFELNK